MRPAILVAITLSVFCCSAVSAQKIVLVDESGLFYSYDTSFGGCSTVALNTPACGRISPDTNAYNSMAMHGDTLYVTTYQGNLYRTVAGDTASCKLLALGVYTIAMTVDDNGIIYWVDGNNALMRYDPHIGQNINLGILNYSPAGDLVFYEKNLIMACNENSLINVNIDDPGKSTVYMQTPGYAFWGLASLSANCQQHIILGFEPVDSGTNVVEIDMAKKTVIGTLCRIPVYVQDAASVSESGGYGLLDPPFPTNDTTLCKGNSIILSAGNPGAGYVWDDNSTGESRMVDEPGKYWVTVSASGCIVSDTLNCTFITAPVIQFPGDTVLCAADSLILHADFPNTTYKWQDGSTRPDYVVTRAGTYSVEATNVCAMVIDSVKVHGLSILIFSTDDTVLCKGSSAVLDAGNPGASYIWDDNSTGETRTVEVSGKYWVMVNDAGCIASDSINCTFVNLPVVQFPKDTVLCTIDSLTLHAGFPYTTYTWQDGSTGPDYTVTHAGVYAVTASDACGTVTDSVNVQFENCSCTFYVPNAFTPNHNGANNLFMPQYKCLLNDTFDGYRLKIFNRWGQLIFSSTNIVTGWDGSFQEKPQPADTYVWQLGYNDKQTGKFHYQKGTVLLIR
jgi:gliding motility-associated-like protein